MENNDLILKGQKKLFVTGIKSVDSMTDKQIDIQLTDNRLVVKGEGLTVSKLDADNGNLEINGEIVYSLTYTAKNKARLNVAKLFK